MPNILSFLKKSSETQDTKKSKPGFFRRLGRDVKSWTGIDDAVGFAKDIRIPGKKYFNEQKQLYADNIAQEETFQNLPFDEVLRRWDIHSDNDEAHVIKRKRWEICLGIFLLVFGSYALSSQFGAGLSYLVLFMNASATISIIILGLVLILSAYWRISVLEHRKFLPFVKWLRNFGSFR